MLALERKRVLDVADQLQLAHLVQRLGILLPHLTHHPMDQFGSSLNVRANRFVDETDGALTVLKSDHLLFPEDAKNIGLGKFAGLGGVEGQAANERLSL